MHGSGKSLCSNVLNALGVEMADQLGLNGPPNADHAPAYLERTEFAGLYDGILEYLDRKHSYLSHDFGFPVAQWADPDLTSTRREIVAFLQTRIRDGYFALENPPTVRRPPLWQQIASELCVSPKVVLCLRNPAEVARSLNVRDGLPLATGEALWLSYILDFFRDHHGAGLCLIEYESWFNDARTNIRKLSEFLELDRQQSEVDLELAVSGIIRAELCHDDPAQNQAKHPLVRTLYGLARRADSDQGARDQIQTLAAQFSAFQQLLSGVQCGFEQIAVNAGSPPQQQQKVTSLREAIAERNAVTQPSQARAEVAEARAAADVAARENAERDAAELRAALAANEAKLAGFREMLGKAEQQVQEREQALVAGHAELAALREMLAYTARHRHERERALEAAQAELAGLRATAIQAAAIQTERQRTARIERELAVDVQKARAAVLQAEEAARLQASAVQALQEELAATRQVGRRLMDALREAT